MIRWYVLRTMTGQEDRVKTRLENKEECLNILLPKNEITYKVRGKERKRLKPLFPGYIFVQMELQDEYRYLVKNTPGVINFIGFGNKPSSVEDIEIENILEMIEKGEAKEPTPFEVGDHVHVTEGPFMGVSGFVSNVDSKKDKLKVDVEILGKRVPVELSFKDVKGE